MKLNPWVILSLSWPCCHHPISHQTVWCERTSIPIPFRQSSLNWQEACLQATAVLRWFIVDWKHISSNPFHANVRNSAIWYVCWSFCPKPHSCHTNTPCEREGRFRVHLLISSSTEANSHFPRVYFQKSLTFPIRLPLPFCHLGEPKCWMCALNRTQIIIKTKSVFIIGSYKSIYSFSI